MELADLRTLLVVSEEGSFSRAADLLHRTQPAVSLAVRRLEQRIGTSVFTRASKRPELTEAGRLLVGYAQQMNTVQREARAALEALRAVSPARLRVGLDERLVAALLPLLRDHQREHPGVAVELVTAGADALARLARGELELAVVHGPAPGGRFEAAAIGTDRFVGVVPPGHALAARSRLAVAELAAAGLVDLAQPDGASPNPAEDAARRAARLRLPTLHAVTRAVEHGVGVAVLPRGAVAAELAAGRLVAVPLDEAPEPEAVWLVRFGPLSPSPAVAALMDRAAALHGAAGDLVAPPRPVPAGPTARRLRSLPRSRARASSVGSSASSPRSSAPRQPPPRPSAEHDARRPTPDARRAMHEARST